MITDLINQKILNKPSIKLNVKVICFFASNPIFFFNREGRPKTYVSGISDLRRELTWMSNLLE
jgi:hypothetical protein